MSARTKKTVRAPLAQKAPRSSYFDESGRPLSRREAPKSPQAANRSPQPQGRGRRILFNIPMVQLAGVQAKTVRDNLNRAYRAQGGRGTPPPLEEKGYQHGYAYFAKFVEWARARGELRKGGVKKAYRHRPGQRAEISGRRWRWPSAGRRASSSPRAWPPV